MNSYSELLGCCHVVCQCLWMVEMLCLTNTYIYNALTFDTRIKTTAFQTLKITFRIKFV